MRKHWIDNLRWVTVLLVLLYHVVYYYNNKGVFGGIGGFGEYPEVPQYQDVLMYILYPWFMPLLFILAGISARYSLERHSARDWFKARTRKLLVPGTLGLLVFHWIVGYFNTAVAARQGVFDGIPALGRYFIMAVSGIGPLWFIQVLWLLCLVLLLVRTLDRGDKFWTWCGKANIVWIIMLGVLFWAGEQTLVRNPRPQSLDGLLNLYKPLFYMIPFLLGYFVFSHDEVQAQLGRAWIPLMACAVVSGGILVGTTFGQDNTSPQYLGSPLNCLYGWLMCLAMMGWFKAKFDRTGAFAAYLTRSSYGIYIVHYLVIASLGYMMKTYTQLPPWSMYAILTIVVFTLSPLLYEALHRIPLVRWCVFGEKQKKA
jgi:surface polysaccharide O-acyltransferase-like enzyme